MAQSPAERKAKAKGGKAKAKGGKPKAKSADKVYTRPELYEDERPLATWLVRIAIVVSMVVIGAMFRQPLHEAVASVFGRLNG